MLLRELQDRIYTDLFRNAVVFVNDSIAHFNRGINSYDNRILAVIELQMALEIAIKSCIIKDYGIRVIFEKVAPDCSDEQLFEDYKNNRLRVREFDGLKNYLKGKREYSEKLSEEFVYMEKFQNYRNKLVHFNYNFSDEQLKQLETDYIRVLVHILHVLMSSDVSDEEYREYMYEHIEMEEYKKLLSNRRFNIALYEKLEDEYSEMYFCPICSRRLVTPYMRCLGCLGDLGITLDMNDDPSFGFVECQYCGTNTVVYDKANIDINTTLRGLCLRCEEDTTVYKCPKCGSVTNLEAFDSEKCRFDYCAFED
ncbi:MAG: hypothetical protein IJ010_00200 [Ruminococcus sp.]|nr:hypothetical protein [Ruminococcus sp.]